MKKVTQYVGVKPFHAKAVDQAGVPGYVLRVGDSTSWVRKDVLEGFAEPLKDEDAHEKVALINERQQIEVFIAQLQARLAGLTPEVEFDEQRALLKAQSFAMRDYVGILNRRIAIL